MRRLRRTSGFTLIEAMVVLVVLSFVAVGVGVGLQAATRTPEINDRALAISAELTSEMENWRAVAWGSSPWPSSFPYSVSNTVTLNIGGQAITYNRTISIQKWDPNNLVTNTSPQTDFVRVQITVGPSSMTCFLTNPI